MWSDQMKQVTKSMKANPQLRERFMSNPESMGLNNQEAAAVLKAFKNKKQLDEKNYYWG